MCLPTPNFRRHGYDAPPPPPPTRAKSRHPHQRWQQHLNLDTLWPPPPGADPQRQDWLAKLPPKAAAAPTLQKSKVTLMTRAALQRSLATETLPVRTELPSGEPPRTQRDVHTRVTDSQ